MNPYALLAAAIALEVIATSLLKASDGMTRWLPACGALVINLFSKASAH